VRSIAAANDGGSWVFYATGDVQSFEQTECYLAPRVRDRFTPDILRSYCRALGIDVFSEAFYKPSAVLTEHHHPNEKKVRSMTLSERRRELGLEL
jgi:hypothetical protein